MDWDFVPLYRPEGCTQFNDISCGPLLLGLTSPGWPQQREKHATPLQEQFSSIAVLQIQTRVLNKDWEHTFPVTRSFINVGSPVR